ncbi:sensor histidine kinase [Isoptericola sp. NPDC019482]|uniref:sensor histidine kinase n=1 Tax=Isoptericola sp. NPDC019482 TaxID=3154688 RepID=UPI0034929E7A
MTARAAPVDGGAPRQFGWGALAGASALVTVLALALPGSPVWPSDLRAGVAVSALAWSAAGWACLARPRARTFAIGSLAGGAVLAAACVGGSGWFPEPLADRLWLVAALGILPVALVEFPGPGPREIRAIAVPVLVMVGGAAAVLGRSPATTTLELVMLCTVVGALWWRFERADRAGREQLLWPVVAGGTAVVVAVPAGFLGTSAVVLAVQLVALVCLPAGCTAGLLGPPSVDVRAVVVRVAATATTVVVAVAVFEGLVAVLRLRSEPQDDVPAGFLALAAVAVAVGFGPVRAALHGAFDRLVRGEPVDAVSAAAHVGSELSGADDPTGALAALRGALGLPYAAVETPEGEVRWSSGAEVGRTYAIDLSASDRAVGRLVVGARDGESTLRSSDRGVLGVVVPTLAQALHARRLAEDLAQSREQVVTAVEEDRRRLRHELHDGLGPTLTGVAYAADAARNLLGTSPDDVERLLADLRADTGQAIAEVRRIVDGLRPSALDELGLAAALRQHATHLYSASGARLEVRLVAADLPRLSAATEVAVYRIVTEALTNVARHSGARTAAVSVAVQGGAVVVEISDDGPGAADGAPWAPGVGLTSLRERAEQLGGTFAAGPLPVAGAQGGRVRAVIPMA